MYLCVVLRVSHKKQISNSEYFIGDYKLANFVKFNDLGVTADTQLCYNPHMNEIILKSNKLIGFV